MNFLILNSSCPWAKTSFTNFILNAFFASIFLADKIKSKAFTSPKSLGALCVPASPGKNPNLISGNENIVLSLVLAILYVQASTSSSPPPKQDPLI